jgi:NADH-quinone oxidoreductase subunit M
MVSRIHAMGRNLLVSSILQRVVGKILYGKVLNPEHLKLTDATWDERVAVICLIACVAGLGMAPFWISDLISNSVEPIISQLLN